MAGDPHALHRPAQVVTLAGSEFLARPLTLGGRHKVNEALKRAWPHPVVQAQTLIREAGIEDEATRQKVMDRALALWDGSGWPVTLDSPLGRLRAMASVDVLAVVIQHALITDQPDITEDDAIALGDRASVDEIYDIFAVAFGIERKIFREALGKLTAATATA